MNLICFAACVETFAQPGRILRQLAQMPDGRI
jgi:predicted transcriptional regulator